MAKSNDRLTFKREPRQTGLARVGNPTPNVTVKLGGKEVGILRAPTWRSAEATWSLSVTVADESSSAGWKWVTLKKRFATEAEGREWLAANVAALDKRYKFARRDP